MRYKEINKNEEIKIKCRETYITKEKNAGLSNR